VGCGQGSLIYFLQKLLHRSREDIDQLLLNYAVDYSLSFLDEYKDGVEESEMAELDIQYDTTRIPTWIFDREFTADILQEWRCGTDESGNLVIPIHDKNERLVGTITRRLEQLPKYLYSKGLRKSRVLFGGYRIQPCDFVCITEGSLDTIWLTQNGFPAIALLGATLSQYQADLLLQLPTPELVLCLDNDEAGKIGTSKALTALSSRCKISRVELKGGYKDVQDVRDKVVLTNIINERTFW